MSLRSRLLAAMALVAAVLIAVAALITVTTRAHLIRQVDERLMALDDVGRPPGPNQPASQPANQPASRSLCTASRPDDGRLSDIYEGAVCDGELRDLALPTGADDGPALTASMLQPQRSPQLLTAGSVGGDTTYRVLISTRSDGAAFVRAKSLDDVNETVGRLLTVQAVGTAGILALLALASWWVLRLGIRPVKQMTAAATRIADGDLDATIPAAAAGTESGELSSALNAMLTQIRGALDQREESERRLRQFVADASHELRTPLTTIRGYAELHRHGALDDPAARADAMRRTEQEAARMGRLVEDLLTLAKLDEGRPLRLATVDLTTLVGEAASDVELASGRHIGRSGGPVTLVADADQLRQAVLNVLNNAIVHTAETAAVDVTISATATAARLVVRDAGDGVASDVAARLTERFFRVDASRSRRRGGSGLGLAIVAEIVAAHGGTIDIASEPGVGTAVTIELPRGGPSGPAPATATPAA